MGSLGGGVGVLGEQEGRRRPGTRRSPPGARCSPERSSGEQLVILYSISSSADHYTMVNSVENEILYNIITATERRGRGKCHICFPSLTFQNPEEGGDKPLKHRFWIKKKVIIISLFWRLDCFIKIHSIHLSVCLKKLLQFLFSVLEQKLVRKNALSIVLNLKFHFPCLLWRK